MKKETQVLFFVPICSCGKIKNLFMVIDYHATIYTQKNDQNWCMFRRKLSGLCLCDLWNGKEDGGRRNPERKRIKL